MTKWRKFWHYVYLYCRYDFLESLRNIRRRIWNKHLKLWWFRIFIRKDEFDRSLDTDDQATMVMDKKEWRKYRRDLVRRREIADKRDQENAEREKQRTDK